MNANTRGLMIFGGLIVFAIFFCFLFPFVVLPSVGTAVTLPVITVPAEYYRKDWPSADFELVNSLGGALLANIIVLGMGFWAWRASKGWKKEVPNRFQGFMEVIISGLWGFTKQQAGSKPKVKNIMFPLVASIFLFLFAGNLGKLLPGVETVGVLHCAVYEPVAFNGFPIHEVEVGGTSYFALRSEQPLNTGTTGTEKSYKRCEAGLGEAHYIEQGYLITELDPFLDQAIVHRVGEGETLAFIAEGYMLEAEERSAEPLPEEGEAISSYAPYHYESWAEVEINAEDILALNDNLIAADGGDVTSVDTPLEAGQDVLVREELFGEYATTMHNQIYTVAPFIRGVSTDLSFTIGLAILAFIAIQYFGISELGLGYFQKFVNIHALGNLGKRPLGAIDFIVGLFEIISEFAKIISLSFRLFGALFAGTVLYAVIMFLVGTTIPMLILALEIIVGFAQAGVFAVLTLIFCAQAMVSHHHDDDDHAHEAH